MGSDGSLTGYAGGIDKKIRLLQLEGGKEPVEMTPGIVMSFKPGNTQNIINPKA